jgi:hypothetical protein
MTKYMKVDGNPDLIRDKTSGAILNINNNEASAARARKYTRKMQKEKEENLYIEVESIKKDVNEIKDLLNKILEVSNGNNSN